MFAGQTVERSASYSAQACLISFRVVDGMPGWSVGGLHEVPPCAAISLEIICVWDVALSGGTQAPPPAQAKPEAQLDFSTPAHGDEDEDEPQPSRSRKAVEKTLRIVAQLGNGTKTLHHSLPRGDVRDRAPGWRQRPRGRQPMSASGRPTKLDDLTAKRICDAIAAGNTRRPLGT